MEHACPAGACVHADLDLGTRARTGTGSGTRGSTLCGTGARA
jgi:hypothetical protein